MDPDRRNRALRQLADVRDEAARRAPVLRAQRAQLSTDFLAKFCLAARLQRAWRAQLVRRRAREEVDEIREQRRIAAEEIAEIIEQAAPPLPIETRVENIEIRVANIEESNYDCYLFVLAFAIMMTGMIDIIRRRGARDWCERVSEATYVYRRQ